MRALVMALLFVAATALLPAVDASSPVTITLRVAPMGFVVPSHWLLQNQAVWLIDPATTTTFNKLPGVAGCTLSVASASGGSVNGGQVLDAAAAAGCISGWSYGVYPGLGRYVTMVDDVAQQTNLGGCLPGEVCPDGLAAWWLLQVDGYGAPTGIDSLALGSGQSLELVYYPGPL